jgi:hypothetical protein
MLQPLMNIHTHPPLPRKLLAPWMMHRAIGEVMTDLIFLKKFHPFFVRLLTKSKDHDIILLKPV